MQIKEIDIQTAHEHFKNDSAIFIDIRDEASHARSHIKGSMRLTDQNLEEFINKNDKSKFYIIYCYHGHSSQSACAYLMNNGFDNIVSMSGGFTQWDIVFGG